MSAPWVIVVSLAALAGCAPPPASRPAYAPLVVRTPEWQRCVNREIERAVSEVWAAPAARGEWPPSSIPAQMAGLDEETAISRVVAQADGRLEQIPDAAMQKCFPPNKMRGIYDDLYAQSAYDGAKQRYIDQIVKIDKEKDEKKAAKNQEIIEREEPHLWAAFRKCTFDGAARLALVSDEPAETIVTAAFAACRPQRMALIDLHKRYNDRTLTDQIMDEVEVRISGALVLEVIRARATKPAYAPPPQTTPAPSNPEQSI